MARADFFEAQTAHGPEPLAQQLTLKVKPSPLEADSFYEPLIKVKGISKSVSGAVISEDGTGQIEDQ